MIGFHCAMCHSSKIDDRPFPTRSSLKLIFRFCHHQKKKSQIGEACTSIFFPMMPKLRPHRREYKNVYQGTIWQDFFGESSTNSFKLFLSMYGPVLLLKDKFYNRLLISFWTRYWKTIIGNSVRSVLLSYRFVVIANELS